MNRLQEKYNKEIAPALVKELKRKSVMNVPKLEKKVVNAGIGRIFKEAPKVKAIESQFSAIVGQKAIITKAKKSVAGFKIREGMPIGIKVTLRKDRMYEFFDRFISIVLPRTRDFSGISIKSFDQSGNISIGIKDCSVFPELDSREGGENFPLEITIVMTSKNEEESKALLTHFGFPLKKGKK
ncbi:50S ribosomal protein L5 [bacterium]|nr:MAG: 50S ribosomal protein L5 [bacterium]